VVAGATFTVLSPMIIIAQKYGLPAVYGAMLCSGVFGLLIAKPFSMMIRFFPPLVAGTVIWVIGLSLIGADVSLIAGDNPAAKGYGHVSHIALAGLVMLLIVVARPGSFPGVCLVSAFGGDGRGDLEGGLLERGHDARGGVVGHPGLRA
jgi:xanthine/uracil permease